jgi:hypothetical protein
MDLDLETGSDIEPETIRSTATTSALKATEGSNQVSGAQPKVAMVQTYKRQHTTTDLSLPSKKPNDSFHHPASTKVQSHPQTQSRSLSRSGQSNPPIKK